MSDKIAEIRKRHSKRSEIDQSGCYRLDGLTYMGSLAQSQEDVDTLLAEVERHRAEIERMLQAIGLVTTTVPDMEIDIENPVGMAQRVVAEFKKQRVEIERLRENVDRAGKEVERADRLRAEIARVKSDERENRAEIKRLRAEMQSAKADAWDEGYQDHQEMIDGIARKPSNPYR